MIYSAPFRFSDFSERRIPLVDVTYSAESLSGRLFSETLSFWVDSGFDGFLKLPESYASRFFTMGIPATDCRVGAASGISQAFSLLGKINKIKVGTRSVGLKKAVDCEILCVGDDDTAPLIGLSALYQWNVCLNLPKETLSFDPV